MLLLLLFKVLCRTSKNFQSCPLESFSFSITMLRTFLRRNKAAGCRDMYEFPCVCWLPQNSPARLPSFVQWWSFDCKSHLDTKKSLFLCWKGWFAQSAKLHIHSDVSVWVWVCVNNAYIGRVEAAAKKGFSYLFALLDCYGTYSATRKQRKEWSIVHS